jgi:predicted  nucleic acid-binding Zn-ribbon protein
MTQVTNELMYEVLKSIQGQVALIREDMDSVKSRVTALDGRFSQMLAAVAGLHGDIAEVSGRMDRLDSRMGRVENRLNFHDPQ